MHTRRQRRIQVAFVQADAAVQAVVVHVALRYHQRVRRQVHGIERRVRPLQRGQDRQAAGAGAQLQHIGRAVLVRQPRGQSLFQQLADEAARHDHAFVHVEAHAVHVGFVREVGGGHAVDGAALDHLQHGGHLLGQQARVEERLQRVERQVQRVQDQVGGFVVGVLAAVAEDQAGGGEARHGIAQQVAHRGERMGGG